VGEWVCGWRGVGLRVWSGGVGGCVYKILFDVIHINQPKFPCRFHRSFFHTSLPRKYGFLDYSRVV